MARSTTPPVTALERHAAFFDRGRDGVITPTESYRSLRLLKMGPLKASVVALGVHILLGPPVSGRWSLKIPVDRVFRGRHRSDTEIYDHEGRFVPEAFTRIFDRFDRDSDGMLDKAELADMIAAHSRERPGGSLGSRIEFALLLKLVGERSTTGARALSRATLQKFYDGDLFYDLAGETPPWR